MFASSILLLGLLLATSAEASSPSDEAPQPRGILLIISDSLRADHLGSYGYARATSPNIDDLAREAVVFERSYSQASWTTPSVASIFTSLHPSVHRTGHPKSLYGYRPSLAEGIPTLAELLRAAGFRTRGLLNNPAISERLGFARGFESYRNDEVMFKRGATPATVDDALAILAAIKDETFLLVWHLIDPHWPYYPPDDHRVFVDPAYAGPFKRMFPTSAATPLVAGTLRLRESDRRQIIDLYDGEIRYMDAQVGRMLDTLEQWGMRERVTVVMTSDHGESFGEFGHYGHEYPMYQDTLHVPLIIRDSRFAARRIHTVVQSIDIMPTLLQLAGVDVPTGLQGRSLVPLLADLESGWETRPAYSEASQLLERKAITVDQYSLIWGPTGFLLHDMYEVGGAMPRIARNAQPKLYRLDEGVQRPATAAEAERESPALYERLLLEMRNNEQKQRARGTQVRSFHFLEDWREQTHQVKGEVHFAKSSLSLAPDAQVQWRVGFDRPARGIVLHAVGECRSDVPFFSVSADGRSWESITWSRPQGFRPLHLKYRAPDGKPWRELYFRFADPKGGDCRLDGFYLEANVGDADPVMDAETRRQLRALGYAD